MLYFQALWNMFGCMQAVLQPMLEVFCWVQGGFAGDGECGHQGTPLPVQARWGCHLHDGSGCCRPPCPSHAGTSVCFCLMPACLPACLPAYLPACLLARLPICPSVCPSVCLFTIYVSTAKEKAWLLMLRLHVVRSSSVLQPLCATLSLHAAVHCQVQLAYTLHPLCIHCMR